MDEATGQAKTTTRSRGKKRRRNDAETSEHDTVERESAVVKEEIPSKKVNRCHNIVYIICSCKYLVPSI